VQLKLGLVEAVGLGLHSCHGSIKARFRIMGAFEGPNGGDFDLRGLVGCIGLIGAVKIRIGVGSWVKVTRLLSKHLDINYGNKQGSSRRKAWLRDNPITLGQRQ
jgi:hypothetical protein